MIRAIKNYPYSAVVTLLILILTALLTYAVVTSGQVSIKVICALCFMGIAIAIFLGYMTKIIMPRQRRFFHVCPDLIHKVGASPIFDSSAYRVAPFENLETNKPRKRA